MSWITQWTMNPFLDIWHLDGVSWNEAETPPWNHACWAQTRANDGGIFVERCPCGAINYDPMGIRTGNRGDRWLNINETRKNRGEVNIPPRPSSWWRRLARRAREEP